MHFISWAIWFISMAQLVPFLILAQLGIRLRKERENTGEYPDGAIGQHRTQAWAAIGVMLFAVACVEAAIRSLDLLYAPFFGRVHVPILVALVATLFGSFIFNGAKWQRTHRFWTWSVIVLIVAAAASGDYLVYTQIYALQ